MYRRGKIIQVASRGLDPVIQRSSSTELGSAGTVGVTRVMLPSSRQSRDEAPIRTINLPVTAVQLCLFASHIIKSRSIKPKVSRCCSPGFSVFVLMKPLSCHGGSPADDGKPRYNCATSRPATSPVFFMEHETSDVCSLTRRLVYLNVVYESPFHAYRVNVR